MRRKCLLLVLILVAVALSPALAAKKTLRVGVSPAPADLVVAARFSEPSGNNILDAGETGKIEFTVTNRGRGDAFDVRAQLTLTGRVEGLSFRRDLVIGTVPAGGSARAEVDLIATEEAAGANISLTADFKEANGFDPGPVRVSFALKSFEPPRLIVADLGIRDSNDNGRIDPGEIVELTVRVQNVGHGDAREVAAEVTIGENVFLAEGSKAGYSLGNIRSGEFTDFQFSLYTNRRIAGGQRIPVSVSLKEARPRFAAEAPLGLVMNAPPRQLQEVVVRGLAGPARPDIPVAGGLSVDVDLNIPEGQKAGRFDIAVVIGNQSYAAAGIPDVDYAGRGAAFMKEYLVRTMGYDPENILFAQDATLSKFNEFFGTRDNHRGRLYKFVKEGVSRVFIFYTGHGAPDLESGDAYFVPVDARPEYIRANGYALRTFYDNLGKIPARQITVVLDSCFSGNTEKGFLFKGISPAMVRVKKEVAGPQNALVITSGAADQVAVWYPEKRHSLFTYFFLKGLQGEADTNRDRQITVGEMGRYLKENVPYMARRLKGIEQQPVLQGGAEGDVLAVLK